MKYIDAEKLKAEVEKRREDIKAYCLNPNHDKRYDVVPEQLAYILDIIDSLPEEKPSEDLEEAAKEYVTTHHRNNEFPTADSAFIAGAEWMANQTPMPEDTVIFMKGVAEGRRLEREDREENKRKEDELPRFYGD